MKVAVISNQPNQGQSSFCTILATVFAKTQNRKAAILSTGSLQGLLEQVNVLETNSSVKTMSIFKALVEESALGKDNYFDYAYRIGENEVYAFNLFSDAEAIEAQHKLFMQTFKTVNAELVLVEIKGDYTSGFNRKVIEEADAILYLVTTNKASIQRVKEFKDNFDPTIVAKTGFICQKYDRNALNEKRVAAAMGIPVRNFMQIPYSQAIIKASFEGSLETIARMVARGHETTMSLRPKLQEIMQFLFDSDKVKYIKEVGQWYK